jgi:hypothetical protein
MDSILSRWLHLHPNCSANQTHRYICGVGRFIWWPINIQDIFVRCWRPGQNLLGNGGKDSLIKCKVSFFLFICKYLYNCDWEYCWMLGKNHQESWVAVSGFHSIKKLTFKTFMVEAVCWKWKMADLPVLEWDLMPILPVIFSFSQALHACNKKHLV